MVIEVLLLAWTAAGLTWWLISWWLVVTTSRQEIPLDSAQQKKSLSIFKPLPPLESEGLKIQARGLESFIAQLDAESELLLGVHEPDWPEVKVFIQKMKAAYPQARLVVVRRSEIDTLHNPKIAWQKLLVPQAQGELWLWSDADIVAPPGFLNRARAEFTASGAEMLTFPYAIYSLPHPPALLDALFVNAEFYPGVLLLRRLGPVDFGLGAAMLFTRESFLRRVDWEKLGCSLADDFVLGQILQPVRLSAITLETVADATDWSTALDHYFRWKKTVCWCRPLGFAAQIMIMPLLGWIGMVLFQPTHLGAWVGLFCVVQMDVFFTFLICCKLGCRLNGAALLATEGWSFCRVFFWLLCWWPQRVKWREKFWRHVHQPG